MSEKWFQLIHTILLWGHLCPYIYKGDCIDTQKKNIICLNVKIIVGQTQNRCYKTRLQKLVTRYIEGQLCVHHKHS